jgi:uncharacterized repeat protein (TIGR03803 family)
MMTAAPLHAQYTVLHNFTGGSGDGARPLGDLTLSGSLIYGVTDYGGSSNYGTAFSMNSNGTGFSLLRSFTGGTSDGKYPDGTLKLDGSTLYGVTHDGGSGGNGTVFSMNTSGTSFSILHNFTSGAGDGSTPGATMVLSGSTLYGMTSQGGSAGVGTVFRISTDGTGFSLLHTFTGGADGSNPYGSLTLSGSKLYGMAWGGGSASVGTAFSLNTDGTSFSLLHTFAGGASDGKNPNGALTLSGSKLYGMTMSGGSGSPNGDGTVFSMNTDGTGFSLLHSFNGSANDGTLPIRDLTLSGSTLYGMTYRGGSNNLGTMFQINTDGTGYNLLHTFGGTGDGSLPGSDLTISGSILYGTTTQGGSANNGIVFSYQLTPAPEPSSFVLSALGMAGLAAARRRRSSTGGA